MATKYIYELNDDVRVVITDLLVTIKVDDSPVVHLTKQEAEKLALVIIRNI